LWFCFCGSFRNLEFTITIAFISLIFSALPFISLAKILSPFFCSLVLSSPRYFDFPSLSSPSLSFCSPIFSSSSFCFPCLLMHLFLVLPTTTHNMSHGLQLQLRMTVGGYSSSDQCQAPHMHPSILLRPHQYLLYDASHLSVGCYDYAPQQLSSIIQCCYGYKA